MCELYINDRNKQISRNMVDRKLQMATSQYAEHLVRTNYMKNFTWMGVPILQYPTDLMVMQELIWEIKPDLIIECGVAFGGMTKFYASMLNETWLDSTLVSIDIDVRPHTRDALMEDPVTLGKHILIEGSSTSPDVMYQVMEEYKEYTEFLRVFPVVLISLDSNHTHDHVLQELQLYSPLVSVGSYIVVFDTNIEEFGHLMNQDRPWHKGNNPATAVQSFMKDNNEFIIDREVETRALITAAPGGWLKRVKEGT